MAFDYTLPAPPVKRGFVMRMLDCLFPGVTQVQIVQPFETLKTEDGTIYYRWRDIDDEQVIVKIVTVDGSTKRYKALAKWADRVEADWIGINERFDLSI